MLSPNNKPVLFQPEVGRAGEEEIKMIQVGFDRARSKAAKL